MGELRTLRSSPALVTPTQPDVPPIAVLPFDDMSPQKDQDYFCEGVAEEIINALSDVDGLRVAARTSSFKLKGQAVDATEIGTHLHVDSVLEGSVRKAGTRLRITAQLINVADGFQLWSDRYDRDMDDIFAVQDDIARSIAGRLNLTLRGGIDPLVMPPSANMDSYDAFLKGRFLMRQREPVGLKQAVVQFEHAVSLDPKYAAAYAGVADVNSFMGGQGVIDTREANTAARRAAARALELDPRLVEPHITLVWRDMSYEWDQASAARHFAQALELGPDSADADSRHVCYLAWVPRRFDEAVTEARRGVELDLLNASGHTWLTNVLWVAGRFDEAIATGLHAVELDRSSMHAYHSLGQSYLAATRYQEAINAYRAAIRQAGRHPWSLAEMALAHARSGATREATAIHAELVARSSMEYVAPAHLACVCGELGKTDQAFEFLERAYEARDSWMIFLRFWHFFDSLRTPSHGARDRLPHRPLRRDRPHRRGGMGEMYRARDTSSIATCR